MTSEGNEVWLSIRGPIEILQREKIMVKANVNLTWEEMFREQNIVIRRCCICAYSMTYASYPFSTCRDIGKIQPALQVSVYKVGSTPTIPNAENQPTKLNEKILDFIKKFKNKGMVSYSVRLHSAILPMPYKGRGIEKLRIGNVREEDQNLVGSALALPDISGTATQSFSVSTGQREGSIRNHVAMPPSSNPGPSPCRQIVASEICQDEEAEDQRNNQNHGDEQNPIDLSFHGIHDAGPRSSNINGQDLESTPNHGAIQPSTSRTPESSNQHQQSALTGGNEEHTANQSSNQGLPDQQSMSAREENGTRRAEDTDRAIDYTTNVHTQASLVPDDFTQDEVAVDERLKVSMLKKLEECDTEILMEIHGEIRDQRRRSTWNQNALRTPKACYLIRQLFTEAVAVENVSYSLLKPLVVGRLQRFSSEMLNHIQDEIRGQIGNHGWDHCVIATPFTCHFLQVLFNVN